VAELPPPPAPHSGGPFRRFGDSIWRFSPCGSHQFQALYRGEGGGWLGLPSRGLSPKHKDLVFWLFLLSYMTSVPFSYGMMVFSPINTAFLLILFWPSCDGYSLLCSSKSIFRGTDIKREMYLFKIKPIPYPWKGVGVDTTV
jgi:hypothetical protein